tara:strand:- start:4202 stop:4702 length:501 start_codon:yes stop_codon:yes gene_type:complete
MEIGEFAAVRDSNKGKDNLIIKEMSFIWFFADIRSDFQNVIDEEERTKEVIASISLPAKWKPSKEVLLAIEFYKEHSKTASSGLYEASMRAAQFIEGKLNDPAGLLGEVDAKGNNIYKITDITTLLKSVPQIMKNLAEARIQVIKEIESKSKLKGGKEKSMFEDDI